MFQILQSTEQKALNRDMVPPSLSLKQYFNSPITEDLSAL